MVLGAAALAVSASPAIAKSKKMEKCYGVSKAGQNDCSSSDGRHGCAAQSAKDGDKTEWILVPKGTCKRIVGGSLS